LIHNRNIKSKKLYISRYGTFSKSDRVETDSARIIKFVRRKIKPVTQYHSGAFNYKVNP